MMNELDPEQLRKLEEVLRARAYAPGTSREAWESLLSAHEEVKRVRKEIEYSFAGGRLRSFPVEEVTNAV